jgi:hypothetical protein
MSARPEIQVPERMAALPLDRRGYPVPVNVDRDKNGVPNFAVNNVETRHRLFKEDRCGICGGKLLRGRWAIGGPGSVLHPDGALLDPPMHHECATYAVQACPYLAIPAYTKSVTRLKEDEIGLYKGNLVHNPTKIGGRPDLFVLAMFIGQKLSLEPDGGIRSYKPKRPYRAMEYWQDGERMTDEEGQAAVDAYMEASRQKWDDLQKNHGSPTR